MKRFQPPDEETAEEKLNRQYEFARDNTHATWLPAEKVESAADSAVNAMDGLRHFDLIEVEIGNHKRLR